MVASHSSSLTLSSDLFCSPQQIRSSLHAIMMSFLPLMSTEKLPHSIDMPRPHHTADGGVTRQGRAPLLKRTLNLFRSGRSFQSRVETSRETPSLLQTCLSFALLDPYHNQLYLPTHPQTQWLTLLAVPSSTL